MFSLALLAGVLAVGAIWVLVVPTLPDVESLREVRLQVPLRVFSEDGELMAEIGEQRRSPIALDDVPETLRLAFLAAEDDRFYRHPGIDWRGTLRGALLYARSLGKGRVPGGSTITQQVARRFFLSTEYSVIRKLREMLLALKIEREMSKDEIFELYLNKEFLGHRAYGIVAAAQVYYGRPLAELSIAQMAQLAALPKAPSRDNPISGPRQAMIRRNWVIDRMYHLGYISEQAHAEARAEPNTARYHGPVVELNAPWVAEMARQALIERFGSEEAYAGGYQVHTTVRSAMQRAADQAVRDGLQSYDRRHGWRGPEFRLEDEVLADQSVLEERLAEIRPVADLQPAVVIEADEARAVVHVGAGEQAVIELEDLGWARPFLELNALGARPAAVTDVLQAGDVVRVRRTGEEAWQLAQVPRAEAALVAMEADTGAILAMVGGLDFARNQFNRVTQSRRQPGSSFKPFIYAAALDQGYTPASLVNDAPVVIDDPSLERAWRPTNFGRRFHGPTRLREAMVHSRNLVSVRLLMDIGLDYARDYISDFGFARADLPNGPSMALGSASLTPLSVTTAYSAFANGGYAVEPQFIHRVTDGFGQTVFEPEWPRICPDCPEPLPAPEIMEPADQMVTGPRRIDLDQSETPSEPAAAMVGPTIPPIAPRVISAQTSWLIHSMLSDVVSEGTGRRALALGREDLAGKTGTTNDLRDTWFVGFGGGIVATVWLGMDDNESLGSQEQGGRTALPLWVDFMATALEGREERLPAVPVGLARAMINPASGLRARPGAAGAIPEWFHADNLPPLEDGRDRNGDDDPYDIF
ncbi:MAG: penicillin-binding protein 1A [Wenzhouxiangella sp.]